MEISKKFFCYSGRRIRKYDYEGFDDHDPKYAWNIDHIRLLSLDGKSIKQNLEISHIKTNHEKGDRITFNASRRKFQVKRIPNTPFYGIYDITDEENHILVSKNYRK